jgi:hypothetical protein
LIFVIHLYLIYIIFVIHLYLDICNLQFLDGSEENAGIEKREDEYAMYDPEPGYDEGLKQDGWHIIESRLELRDRQGNNRTLFKRDTDHGSTNQRF